MITCASCVFMLTKPWTYTCIFSIYETCFFFFFFFFFFIVSYLDADAEAQDGPIGGCDPCNF
jgi:hypothetical protein